MKKSGTIVVVEDDLDDQELLAETFRSLNYPNKVIFFSDGYKALEYIESSQELPFLILSDINMPRINGFELRKKIYSNQQLNIRCVPFLFFTTSAQQQAVYDAYSMSAQGFFIKPGTMKELESIIKKIVEYWQECYSPSQFGHQSVA